MTTLSNAQFTAVYNSLADKPVKKFKDLATAKERTEAIVDESAMIIVTDGTVAADNVVEDFGFAVLALQVKEEEAATTAKKSRTEFTDDLLINMNVGENKKRKGSLAHARFAKLMKSETIGDYLDACVKLEPTKPRFKFLADIRWDLNHGFISLSDPAEESGHDLESINEHRSAHDLPEFAELTAAEIEKHGALIDLHAPQGNNPWA